MQDSKYSLKNVDLFSRADCKDVAVQRYLQFHVVYAGFYAVIVNIFSLVSGIK